MNNIAISGRLTKDPECKEFSEGKSVCDITVAVNGYRKEDTIFIKIKAWDGRARSCSKFCKKGSLVNVTGSLRENSWKAKDGSTRKELYVLAADIEFVQRPQEGSSSTPEVSHSSNEDKEPSPIEASPVTDQDLEEVPF